LTSEFAWRFPLSFQVVPPILLFASCWLCPESPRWLVSQGRNEEALVILTKFHGNGNPNAKVVQLEYAELLAAVELEGADKRWWDFRPLFNTGAHRYRMFCILNYAILVQWSGNSLGIYYLPVLVAQSGITNIHDQLLVTCATSTGALALAFVGTYLLERIGRKNCLLMALAGMAGFLAILAGIQSPGPANITPTESHAGIAMIMLFRFIYALGMTPGEQIYTVEMMSDHSSRAKTWACASLVATGALFASTYASPVALANLTWRYYFVFIGLDTMWFFVILFFYPETHGRSLEEMETIFASKNVVKASRLAQKRAREARVYQTHEGHHHDVVT